MLNVPAFAANVSQNCTYPEFNAAFAAEFRRQTGRHPTNADLAAGQWNWERAGAVEPADAEPAATDASRTQD